MTEEEKEMLQRHYERMEEKALAEKKCITCQHRVPGLPFDPYPPQCDFGGEATHTCSKYEVNDRFKQEEKHE